MLDYKDPAAQRKIRLAFFDAFGSEKALSSVAVRQDRENGTWFLDVGATGALERLPGAYDGLEVRVQQVPRAINAIRLPELV
jgi:hypothetical protein